MNKRVTLAVMLSLFLISSTSAIFLDDFLVNVEKRAGWQDWVRLTVDLSGNIYITYIDIFYSGTYDSAVGYIKKYNASGNRLLGPVRLTPEGIFVSNGGNLAVSSSGRVAITWGLTPKLFDVPTHPYVQVLDSNLNEITPLFRVDTDFDSLNLPNANVSDLDMGSSGFFTIIWEFSDTAFYQRFDSLGIPIGHNMPAETPECSPCKGTQFPRLGMSSNGKLALALDARLPNPQADFLPVARTFDSAGSAIVNGILVSCDSDTTYCTCALVDSCLAGQYADIAIQDNGNFLSVFSGCSECEPTNSVFARVLDSLGSPISSIFEVNTENTKDDFLLPLVVTDGRGGYLVGWTDSRNQESYEGRRDLFLQRYDSLGNPIGINFRVNNLRGSKGHEEIGFDVACDGENVYIVWLDNREHATYNWDVYAQVMDLDLVGTYMLGDANFDQQITLADVIYTVNYIFKGNPMPEGDQLVIDVNGDCKVSLSDVIYEVNYIFGKGPPFVPGCLP